VFGGDGPFSVPDQWGPDEETGRYEIQHLLGRGGMGVVYAAHDHRLDRRVAIKFVASFPVPDDRRRDRFVHEVRAASALDHPHICTIYDAGETGDRRAYLVMACYDGETLDARLRRGPVPLPQALQVGSEVAQALAAAHDAQIVHRDLKPANVMLTPAHGVKLLDFGIAKLRDATSLTPASAAVGTPAYASPESIRGDSVDPAADVWALGVLLHEMLTGRHPFEGSTPASILYRILEEDPPALPASVPKPVAECVERCLQKSPSDRPTASDVQALLSEIERPLPDLRISRSRPATRDRPSVPWTARYTAVGIALTLLAVVGVWAWQIDRTDPTPTGPAVVAVLPFGVDGDSSLAYLQEGMVDLLSTQLDGVAGLRSVDPNRLMARVGAADIRDPGRALQLARQVDASRFVLGRVISLGAGFRLHASLYAHEGPPAVQAQVVVSHPGALTDGLDRLAQQLVAGLLDTPDAQLSGLAARTTASFPALRAYLEGVQHARDGRYADAIDAHTSAVTLDSTFALAWYRLARAAGWSGAQALNAEATRQAVRHAHRAPNRVRSIIRAYDTFRNHRPRDAERQYRAILADLPDDAEAWYVFGEALFHNNPHYGRPTAEAREPFERAAMYDPGNREHIVHLMDLAAREERWADLDTLTERYLRPGPSPATLTEPYRSLRALTQQPGGTHEAAWASIKAAGPDAQFAALVRVGPQLRDLDISRRLASFLTDARYPAAWRVRGFLHLGMFDAAAGRWLDAEQAFARADNLDPGSAEVPRTIAALTSGTPDEALESVYEDLASRSSEEPHIQSFLLAWIQAHRRNEEGYRVHATRLQTTEHLSQETQVEARRLRQVLEGVWALRTGRPEAALAHLDAATLHRPFPEREADPLRSQTYLRILRAEALSDLGRWEEALQWYEATHDGYYHWGTPARAQTMRRKGDLYVDLGRPCDARVAYRSALRLWANADASFAADTKRVRTRLGDVESGLSAADCASPSRPLPATPSRG
jgi:tetratricopeptide (TPR) repeat protein